MINGKFDNLLKIAEWQNFKGKHFVKSRYGLAAKSARELSEELTYSLLNNS